MFYGLGFQGLAHLLFDEFFEVYSHFVLMTNYTTLGGRVTCTQCDALSKRTRQRCKAPAVKGKTKCRFHGGAKGSGRPIVHGRETREKRAERSAKLAELRELEELGFKVGLFAEGTSRTRGRKPKLG